MKRLIDVKQIDKLPDFLIESFVVPPFSTLDTRQGYWQDRKRMWNKYLGDTGETRDGEFGRTYNITKQGLHKQTSMFDPVLAELMYKWFCPKKGKVLDPFGGEQTKGIVAGLMGLQYLGVELREEQVEVNNKHSKQYNNVKYICGNSELLNDYVDECDYDFCLTSPPYFNLEEYSKKKADLSGVSYQRFLQGMVLVFGGVNAKLKDDSFVVVKLGDVRDNNGVMLGLVPDFIKLMQKLDFKYYNEIILINQSGSAALRAAGNMKSRKVVKCHQNVLVFYKGDIKHIKTKFEELR